MSQGDTSMLPTPISSRRRPRKSSNTSFSARDAWNHRLQALFARSRATNLAVLLLSSALTLSIVLNLRHWFYGDDISYSRRWSALETVKSIESTIERYTAFQELDHLVIVPGHGVWLGNEAREAYEEDAWALEHAQSGEGARSRIEAFISHIRHGVGLANDDPKSLLIFSGGSTRHQTAVSESASYFSLALALSLIQPTSPLPRGSNLNTYQRTATEDYALDSFQNLLFSIARFRTVTGHYPERITVVGYGMKEARFTELHRAAARWPSEKWAYVGVDIGHDDIRKEAMNGERANGYLPYVQDLYGCHGSLLAKRRSRNVHRKAHPYHVSAPEIAPLLEWCPSTESRLKFAPDPDSGPQSKTDGNLAGLYDGPLPWSAS